MEVEAARNLRSLWWVEEIWHHEIWRRLPLQSDWVDSNAGAANRPPKLPPKRALSCQATSRFPSPVGGLCDFSNLGLQFLLATSLFEDVRASACDTSLSYFISLLIGAQKDKASIVGHVIDYILELEKKLEHLQRSTTAKRDSEMDINIDQQRSYKYQHNNNETLMRPKVLHDSSSSAANPPLLITSSENKAESAEIRIENIIPSASNSMSDRFSSFSSSTPSKSSLEDLGRYENCKDGGTGEIQVEVQSLGKQAVIKVLCARSKGLLLRILAALDECKVEILQSNVTTVGQQVVHFVTIQMIPEASASLQQMECVLRLAASRLGHPKQGVCTMATGHILMPSN